MGWILRSSEPTSWWVRVRLGGAEGRGEERTGDPTAERAAVAARAALGFHLPLSLSFSRPPSSDVGRSLLFYLMALAPWFLLLSLSLPIKWQLEDWAVLIVCCECDSSPWRPAGLCSRPCLPAPVWLSNARRGNIPGSLLLARMLLHKIPKALTRRLQVSIAPPLMAGMSLHCS